MSDSVQLDSLSIVPQSLLIKTMSGKLIPDSAYTVDYTHNILVFYSKIRDTLLFSYRTFPFSFSKNYFKKDKRLIERQSISHGNPFAFVPGDKQEEIISFGSLNKSGSVSRAITVGNNQDLAVNSSFNLQLAGKLNEDVEVLASVTDNNIPIQPEGNTQQIQDFDKVFIQLKNNKNILTVGDFELYKPVGYFMSLNKKVKGAIASTEIHPLKNSTLNISVAGAIAKGKYNRMQFVGLEGNQGPYKLQGANGELFVIILSGTERIYIDGQLLKRGEENDYVIDYNTAELTFTPHKLITAYSRITAEFEYSDKNYTRTLLYSANQFQKDSLKLHFNFYSEEDDKNQPLLQSLSKDEKLFLHTIGDNTNDAIYPNVDSVGFLPNQILYRKKDTLGYKNVFIYSTDPDNAHFRVGFAQVGTGKGNYRQINSSANGKVFEFVLPVNGVPQGDYEPVTLLVTPKKNQLLTLGGEYAFSSDTRLGIETAFCNNDLNLFSDLDDKNNQGIAYKVYLKSKKFLKKNQENELSWNTDANYEFNNKTFRPLDRYRFAEFDRDFNLGTTTINKNENLLYLSSGLFKNAKPVFNYSFRSFIREEYSAGFINGVNSDLAVKGFHLSYDGSLLNSSDLLNQSHFLRQHVELSREISFFQLGTGFAQEQNRFFNKSTDTLAANSFSYYQYSGFIKNKEASINKFKLDYTRRHDFLPLKNDLRPATRGDNINFSSELLKNPNSVLKTGFTFRSLQIEQNHANLQADKSVLGRVEYSFNILKGSINSYTFYETGSGQEPKKEYTYLEVPAGQGVYVWVDYNKNGIKELNEFETAKFPNEANYIRVYLPGNQYVRTRSASFNQALNLDPSRILKNQGFGKIISVFSDQSNFRIDRKILNGSVLSAFNPFQDNKVDTSLAALNYLFRNAFFINRNSPVFGLEINYQKANNRTLLLNGFDTRGREENGLRIHWNIFKQIALTWEAKQGLKVYTSEFFSIKNYSIRFIESKPELTYQFNNFFRAGITYMLSNQVNNPDFGGEKNLHQQFSTELRLNKAEKGSYVAHFAYIINRFSGISNTSTSYEMLDGLQSGNNFTWGLGFQRSLANNLQINMNYEARKSPGVQVIHTGNVQARAFF